jgi:hypothetical protein
MHPYLYNFLFVSIFIGPFIYVFVHYIVDAISDKAEEEKRKKHYGNEQLFTITTYKNTNISKEDIMLSFISQAKQYKGIYFMIDYKVYDDKEEQNYAWDVTTTQQNYGWGTIFCIEFHFSNGRIYLKLSDVKFICGNKEAEEYYMSRYDYGTYIIEKTLRTCKDEAIIMWKKFRITKADCLPFDFIPLTKSKSQNQTKSGPKTQSNLLSFYRDLLGLKLRFTLEELKKSYREAAKKYHPDSYGASSSRDRANAEMLMKQINDAFEMLKSVAE